MLEKLKPNFSQNKIKRRLLVQEKDITKYAGKPSPFTGGATTPA
jgi:hypothetical protein